MSEEAKRPVRVMFLTWGYSIHAQRRISIFCEDHRFDVCVVSTHNYGFQNARNVDLTAAAYARNTVSKNAAVCKNTVSLRERFFGLLPVRLVLDTLVAFRDLVILREAAEKFRPDIIFLQTLMYPCYLSYFLPRTLPIAVTFWNGDVTWWAKWNGIERLLKRWIVTYGARRASAITVNSEAARQASLGYGVTEEHVHLVRYPGVDLARFRPSPKGDARSALSIVHDQVVLAPRGLARFFNSDVIVEAAPLVLQQCPNALFVFLWAADQYAEFERHRSRAEELGIADRFRWDGRVAWDRMPVYYAAADVTVSLSSSDSLPNCMMESMACGIPVVMGDIPVIREWVTNGVNGRIVNTTDPRAVAEAIINIIKDPDRQNETLIKNGIDLIRKRADSRRNSELIKELVLRTACPDAYGLQGGCSS